MTNRTCFMFGEEEECISQYRILMWEILFCNLALKYLNIFLNISDKGSEEKTCRVGEWAEEGEELRGFWGRGGKGRVEVSEGKVEVGGVLRDVADILTWSEKEIYAVTVGRSILGVNIFSATRTVRLCGKPTDHNLCLRSSKSAHNLRRVENVIYTPE